MNNTITSRRWRRPKNPVRLLQETSLHLPDLSEFDLDWRPDSYWNKPIKALLATIRTEHSRRNAKQRLEMGIVEDFATEPSKGTQLALEAYHPKFMGGAYLPEFYDHEVEIARISMESLTNDIVAVWARLTSRGIAYRVVDEYMESGPYRLKIRASQEPLTLAELIFLIATAGREGMNVFHRRDDDPRGYFGFQTITSEFYSDLGPFFDAEELKWFDDVTVGEDDDE